MTNITNNKEDKPNDQKSNKVPSYRIINKEKKSTSLLLEIELPFSQLESKRDVALSALGRELEIKGFRKGSAPKNIVEENLGQAKVIEEMSYQAIVSVLPEIVTTEKINSLTQPQISITKLALGNPLVFKAEFILMPEVILADYKKIAKEIPPIEKVEVTEKEIEDYIDYIRSTRAEASNLQNKTSVDKSVRETANSKNAKTELPDFTDEFVKTLGDFKDVEDFKKKLKENMLTEKVAKETQKRRLAIVEKIIEDSKIEMPEIIVEEELHRMLEQFKGDIEKARMDFGEYLKQIHKSETELYKEWRPDAIKRSKMNLILPKIAFEEKIEADPKLVEQEVSHLKKHYPDISDENAKSYVSHVLRNDEVFKFLEKLRK